MYPYVTSQLHVGCEYVGILTKYMVLHKNVGEFLGCLDLRNFKNFRDFRNFKNFRDFRDFPGISGGKFGGSFTFYGCNRL